MKKEVKIGALVFFALAALIIGGKFLRGNNIFKRSNTYYAKYTDAYGLMPSAAVLVKGMRVGSIKSLQIQPGGFILCTFQIDNDIHIPKSAKANIAGLDIMGTKGLQVEFGGGSNDYFMPEDTIPGGLNLGMMDNVMAKLDPVTLKATSVLSNIDTITRKMNKIMGDEDGKQTKAKLNASLNELQVVLKNLTQTTNGVNDLIAQNKNSMSATMKSVESMTTNLNNNNGKINEILANTEKATKKLSDVEVKQMVDKLSSATEQLNSLMTKMNNKDNSVGMLFNDKKLYDNLSATTNSLNLLLADFRSNPKNYVHMSLFGKKAKPTPIIMNPQDTLGTRLKTDKVK